MVYSWSTKKLSATEYRWQVTSWIYGGKTKVLHEGILGTRAQAEGQAKRTVMLYRRQPRITVSMAYSASL